ncbi:uncharacterized protein LOC129905893 [Episyrphus balteatus]|uniref:uncharacterized protein LOC129905893 n=1 Tax=Episyrphus balteatus TaxID=286459 RepID=UPI002486892D|nr:uncharacterized protein LOC129905893 [Episyrphus balteatus]
MLQNSSRIQTFDIKSINCHTNYRCSVTCSGDMTGLRQYLESQKTCSLITLHISNGIFPENTLQSSWLEGSFNLSSIEISSSDLNEIQNGAFNQKSVANLSELKLNGVEIMKLTENTFVGLTAIEKFTLINRIDIFSGEAFLKPMMKTLDKVTIKHLTSIPTDPAPWLRGENFPKLISITFDGSNLGEYINADTFKHLKRFSLLMMNSCKIGYIANGAFDFMFKQTVVLISLQNNQLKRLSGDYLSQITPLKRLDIQNNPWDCTCELEQLVRVFKEYPEGFGVNSKCSSPWDKTGKLLNEIELKKCEDEPKPPLPTPSSNITTISTTETTPFSLSTSSTALSNSTDLMTTISTVELSSTTPSPQNRTTTLAADSIIIECARHKIRFSSYPLNFIELSPPDGHFTIVSISETSARLIFQGSTEDFVIIWFYEQPNLDENEGSVRFVGEFSIGCQSELDSSLIVEGLAANRSYTFCLVKNGTKVISPFNCQSYFSSVGETSNDLIWLRKKDMPLVIGIFVACVLVSLLIGLIGMFLLILYHPCLLKNSKRIIIVNKNSRKDVIVPRRNVHTSVTESSFANSYHSEATTAELRRFSCESGLSYMMANNYEDIEYRWRMNANNDMYFSNRMPKSPAPPLPKRISSAISTQKPGALANNNDIEQEDNDYGYTSIS